MKETLDNSKSFEPGDLMTWQGMSKAIRDFDEELTRVVAILDAIVDGRIALKAEISDIKTRLDDLEETLGTLLTPEQEYVVQVRKFKDQMGWFPEEDCMSGNSGFEEAETRRLDIPFGEAHQPGQDWLLEQSGTHPPNCRCAWCEPSETGMGLWT